MAAYLRLLAFDFRLYLRDWMTLFWLLIYPVLMLLLFGSMYGNEASTMAGVRYIEIYVPALCALNVITVSVFTLNINMVTLRESGVLRRFKVTPIKASAVLISHAVQGVFLVIVGALEIMIIANIVWDVSISFSSLVALLAVLLYGGIGFFSLGLAMSSLTSTAGAASGVAMVVFFPSLFLSGIMPLEILPEILQKISWWLPIAYFVELAQGVWNGHSFLTYGKGLAVIGAFSLVCCAVAILFFRWEK